MTLVESAIRTMLLFLVLAPLMLQVISAVSLAELGNLIFDLERAIKSVEKLSQKQRYISKEMLDLRRELDEFRSALYNPDIMRKFVSYPESRTNNSETLFTDLFYRFRLETGNPWAYKIDFDLLDSEKFKGLENATYKLNFSTIQKKYPLELAKMSRLLVYGEPIFKIKDMESYRKKISERAKRSTNSH